MMEAVIHSVKSMDLESDYTARAKFFLQKYESLLAHFKTKDPAEAESKVREELEALENTPLNVAITGETGAGKSSFINAIRGVGHEEETAAKTGEIETTKELTPYPHPTNPKVTFWDMPGAEATGYPQEQYAEQVQFDNYDFFIIIASERFKRSHVTLATEIQRQGKRFYFVRSKVDAHLRNAKRQRPSTYDEERILGEIKENCIQSLERETVTSPKVFLISSFDLEKYDFQELVDTLERELPSHKRHAFLLSLPNVSPQILHKKKEALKQQIWKLALLCGAASGGLAVIPDLPVLQILSVPINVAVLLKAVHHYSKSFSLEEKSLAELGRLSGKSVTELKAVIKTPLANDLTVEYVWELLRQSPLPLASSSVGAITATCKLLVNVSEFFLRMLPVVGALTAGALSYIAISSTLHSFLDAVDKDAEEVRKVVLGEGKKSQ